MPSKSVKTLDELKITLDAIGDVVTPERLLDAANLGDDVEKYFELLRDGRNSGELIFPQGIGGEIRRGGREN